MAEEMINIHIILYVGIMKRSGFECDDEITFDYKDFEDEASSDSVNDWLVHQSPDRYNYAELRVYSNSMKHNGFLIGTFKRIKMKSGKTRWIVAD